MSASFAHYVLRQGKVSVQREGNLVRVSVDGSPHERIVIEVQRGDLCVRGSGEEEGAVSGTPGAAAERVARNVRATRRGLGLDLADLSERLGRLGHPIGINALSKIELGKRRVDVTDLTALSLALEVSPVRLLGGGEDAREAHGG